MRISNDMYHAKAERKRSMVVNPEINIVENADTPALVAGSIFMALERVMEEFSGGFGLC